MFMTYLKICQTFCYVVTGRCHHLLSSNQATRKYLNLYFPLIYQQTYALKNLRLKQTSKASLNLDDGKWP